MSFRRIILAEVKRREISGYALAKISGVPMRSVQAYLAGDNDMQGERLALLADALELVLTPKSKARSMRRKGRAGPRR